jgi:tRNA G46 methylase TrmB
LAKDLTNALVINIEAHHYIRNWVNDQAFDAVHIYFPTPFPYSIGLQHRLINSRFIADVHRILKPFGILRIVTDDEEYYEEICRCLTAQNWWALDWRPLEVTASNYFVGTPQEILYREERHPQIFAVRLVRIMRSSNLESSAQSNSVFPAAGIGTRQTNLSG